MLGIRLMSLGVTMLVIGFIAYAMYYYEKKGKKEVLQKLLEDKKITMKDYNKYLKN